MKNISRRNFMKGVAAASLAVATSAVLTGCKLPVGTEFKDEQTGFQPITQTVEFAEDETVTMTVNGYEYSKDSGILAISCKAVNDTKTHLSLDGGTDKGDVTVTAYFDAVTNVGGSGVSPMSGTFADNIAGKIIASNEYDIDGGDLEGKGYFTVDEKHKEWKTVTLVVDVVVDNSQTKKTARFVINR